MVVRLPPPFFSSVSPGPGREVRNWLGWTPLEKTARSGVWGLRGALVGSSIFLHLLQHVIGLCKDRFLQHGWSPLFPRVLVHTCMDEARLSGHKLESGAGHCLIDCGGLSLP